MTSCTDLINQSIEIQSKITTSNKPIANCGAPPPPPPIPGDWLFLSHQNNNNNATKKYVPKEQRSAEGPPSHTSKKAIEVGVRPKSSPMAMRTSISNSSFIAELHSKLRRTDGDSTLYKCVSNN